MSFDPNHLENRVKAERAIYQRMRGVSSRTIPIARHQLAVQVFRSVRPMFEKNNPDLELEWNLRAAEITKRECYTLLHENEIKLPVIYSLGFKNNCLGRSA